MLVRNAGGILANADLLVSKEASNMTEEQLKDEFKALSDIPNSHALCETESLHEASWNELLHSQMLKQALFNRRGLGYYNITAARVVKELVPEDRYGKLLKNKQIDYAIVLKPPLLSNDDIVTRLAASPGPLQETINPSKYSPLCH